MSVKSIFSLLYLLVLAQISPGLAATWYFLRYNTPSGSQFTSFSGTMHIPPLPQKATYYLWPGLQPTDGSGVYQNVLDGRKGTWWIGSGWCCKNPDLPWGSGFGTAKGDLVAFNNVKSSNGNWTSELTKTPAAGGSSQSVKDSFGLGSKSFNQVLFAIELYDVKWDFGPLTFTDVTITATGTDSKWCTSSPENYSESSRYSVTGATASTSGSVVTCKIANVTLISPAK